MNPEMPFLAAGVVSLVGGTVKEGHFPAHGLNAVIGTVALVIVASITANSRFAPVVRAIGLLLLLAAVLAATTEIQTAKNKKKKVGKHV